mgnify:CR=1 FL=1
MVQGKGWQWRSFQTLGLVLILVCSLMRFVHLDSKPYWYDEVYTSLRLSGSTKVDIFEQVGIEQHNFGDLTNFQCPPRDGNLGNVLHGLITDDVHPPLYFALLYYWIKVLGCTPGDLRLFSAILSLLLILASYVLTREIFCSEAIALLTTLLVTNSPIFLIYAQEARQYTLLVLLALSSSIFLCRYLDHKNTSIKNLICYVFLSTAGLYCHTLYYGVVAGQLGYCLFNSVPFKRNHSLIKNILSSIRLSKEIILTVGLSFLLFLIWLLKVILVQGFKITVGADYTWKEFSRQILWQRIVLNFTSIIHDFESPIKSEILTQNVANVSLLDLNLNEILMIVFIPVILLYSLWYTIRHSDRSRTVLLGWLALPSILFLLKDLLLGGSAASIIRYQLLSVFGLYAALSFCSIHLLKTLSSLGLKYLVTALIIILCQQQLTSNFNYLNASSWWSKYGDYQLYEFANRVHQSPQPIVVAEANYREMVNLLKLSYVLDPKAPFQLLETNDVPETMLKSYDIFWAPQI